MASVNSRKGAYAFQITPSDTLELKSDPGNNVDADAAFLYCAASGNLSAVTANGKTLTLSSVSAGTLIGGEVPILFKQVRATGTTGTWWAVVPRE